jgi:hypothetical protein
MRFGRLDRIPALPEHQPSEGRNMTDTIKRFLGVAVIAPDAPTTKGELVPVPSAEPSLAELTELIKQSHAEVIRGLSHSAMHAIRTGELLEAAKKKVRGNDWVDYLGLECRLSERTARMYRQLYRNKDKFAELLAATRQSSAALTQSAMLRLLSTAQKKRRR